MEDFSRQAFFAPFNPDINGGNETANWYRWKTAAIWHLAGKKLSNKEKIIRMISLGGDFVQRALEAHAPKKLYQELMELDIESENKTSATTNAAGNSAADESGLVNLPAQTEPPVVEEKNYYKEAMAVLDKAFAGASNPIAQYQIFAKTKQAVGESIKAFANLLTMLAENCGFTDEEKENMIKRHLLLNTNLRALQKKAVTQKLQEKSLNEVLKVAYEIEQSRKEIEEPSTSKVCAIKNREHDDVGKLECGRCGHYSHITGDNNCPAKNVRCYNCNRIGHYGKKCKEPKIHDGGISRRFNQSFGRRESYNDRRYGSGNRDRVFSPPRRYQHYDREGSSSRRQDSRNGDLDDLVAKAVKKALKEKESFRQFKQESWSGNMKRERSRENSQGKRQKVSAVNEEDDEDSVSNDSPAETVNYVGANDKTERCLIGNVEVNMMLDSGCQRNMIPKDMFDEMVKKGLKIIEAKEGTDTKFKAYGASECLKIKLRFQAELCLNGITSTPWFYVVEGANTNLLGKISAIKHNAMNVGLSKEEAEKDQELFNKIKGTK